ncbi:MAG: VOC family protein [Jiangellaceae bacterium]|nr:VOC family protein [Jiangellaceae bacterium]
MKNSPRLRSRTQFIDPPDHVLLITSGGTVVAPYYGRPNSTDRCARSDAAPATRHLKVVGVTTRLECVAFDALDPAAQGTFWSTVTGWPITVAEQDEICVEPPAGLPGVPLVFLPASNRKAGKNRMHLDLRSGSAAEQEATVSRLCELGATFTDVGQGDVPWTVLSDPEGNELCVLEPRRQYDGTGAIGAIIMDAFAPGVLASFWSAATGWPVTHGTHDFYALRAADGRGPYLELLRTADPKVGKNRLHVDVAPAADTDQAAEVARLRALGATFVDVGQGDVSWTVLADPEGNEFRVLSP